MALGVLCAQSIPQRRGAAVCFVHQIDALVHLVVRAGVVPSPSLARSVTFTRLRITVIPQWWPAPGQCGAALIPPDVIEDLCVCRRCA